MHILIVNNSKIPVTLYGGTERAIWCLGKELAKLRHRVTYLVKAGSQSDFAGVIEIDETKRVIDQIPDDVDLVHFIFYPKDLDHVHKPYVVTIQGNINHTRELDINTIFVSKNHANRHGSTSFVHNGMDWDDYGDPSLPIKRNYFHFLAKAAWRIKNVKGAISVIKRTKSERIKILGGVRFNINMGVRFTLTPRATFCGMVGGEKKDALLRRSKGLLFPVLWHEPFGIAIVESLYFGCPVFGTPYGSLPEIVIKDVGFLSNECEALAGAIENVDEYSNKRCHEYAVEEFNSHKMTLAYLEKYQHLLSGKKLNARPPKLKELHEEKFLEWIE